jgi:hypothetical protein
MIKTIKSLSVGSFFAAVYAAIRYHWTHNFWESFFLFVFGWFLLDLLFYLGGKVETLISFFERKRNVK